MSPVLASIIDPPPPQRGLLKKDWSAEEKAWKEGVSNFLRMIETANQNCCAHEKDEEKKKDQVVSDVIIKTENVGEPVVGPLANESQPSQPSQPKDKMPMTSLDELFDAPFSPPAKEEPKKEDPKKEDPFVSSGKESSFESFPPVAAVPAKEDQKPKQEPAAAAPVSEKSKVPSDISLCDGFDTLTFKNKVMTLVDSILQTTPEVDLEQMQQSIDEYSVQISVDAYRSDLDTIANHIAEIQAKRDSIISPLIKLSSTILALDEVLDFVVNIGVSCSSASNRERRVSEVHYMAGDLFRKYTHVKHLHDQYDKMYRHLGSQMEALSRLLTAQIERAKQVYLGNQRHEDLKLHSELANKGMVSSIGVAQVALDLDKEINRVAEESKQDAPQMPFDLDAKTPSKPTQAVEGMSGLETFSAAPVKKIEKFKKGVVEF